MRGLQARLPHISDRHFRVFLGKKAPSRWCLVVQCLGRCALIVVAASRLGWHATVKGLLLQFKGYEPRRLLAQCPSWLAEKGWRR